MATRLPVELNEESELSDWPVTTGWLALALGVVSLPVLAAVLLWVWWGGPSWLPLALVPVVVLGPTSLVLGLRARARVRRAERLAARHPGEPWWADHPWNREQLSDRMGASILSSLWRLFVGGACAFGLAWYWMGDDNWLTTGFAWICLALIGVGFFSVGHQMLRWVQQGTSRLILDRFPLSARGPASVHFRPGRSIRRLDEVQVTLRFIQESHELRRTLGTRAVDVVATQLYADRTVLATLGRIDRTEGLLIPLRIPDDALEQGWTTRLGERPARYWQLVIEAKRPGIGLRSLFFLPVYGPPGS